MSRPTNKHDRILRARQVLSRRAYALGWGRDIEALPRRTRLALSDTGDIRIDQKLVPHRHGKKPGGRKGFHQHGSGYSDYAGRNQPARSEYMLTHATCTGRGLAEFVNTRDALREIAEAR